MAKRVYKFKNPEERNLKIGSSLKKRWTDPDWRAMMISRRENSPTFKYRNKMKITMIKKWENPEYRIMMEEARRRDSKLYSDAMKRNWQNPEYRKKQEMSSRGESSRRVNKKWWNEATQEEIIERFKRIFANQDIRPTKIEIFVDGLVQTACPEFRYVGNRKVWIGKKNPDWIHRNRNLVIEYFSDYYHGEKRTGRTKEQEEDLRKSHFKKYGYDCLIIWESELKNLENIIEKIKKFVKKI